jgi:carboxypeptidase Q
MLNQRRRFWTGLVLLMGFALDGLAQELVIAERDLQRAEALRDAAISGTRAYDWVERLTTEVGPRLAGSDAERRAREWAINLAVELNLPPARIETFTLPGWRRGEERAQIVGDFAQPLAITALGGSVATPGEGIEAELAYFDTLRQLERMPEGSLAGKIAFVSHAMQKTQDGSSYGYFNDARTRGAAVAASKGAVALLIRSIGTDSHRFPHTGNMRYVEGVAEIPAAAVANPDADQIQRLSQRGKPIRVALYMTPERVDSVESGNVIIDLIGSEFPEEYVVIGAHLDSWDLGTGAIDDGAGVAISMETLRLIHASGLRPRRTIRLILWGAEEVGLVGGKAYLRNYADVLRQHIAATESDFGAGRIWKMTTRVAPEAEPLMAHINNLIEPLGIARGEGDVASAGPDLSPMIAKGMPGFRFVQDGSDYFDLHHTADDTLDKITPSDLDQNVAAFLVFTWLASQSDLDDWGWLDATGD